MKNYNVHCLEYTWIAYKEMHGARKYRYLGTTDFSINERGKKRKISAQKLPDRVKIKCACDNNLHPAMTRGLIWDNGASREGMGTSHTRRRVLRELLRAYRKWKHFYIGMTDGHNYFGSIRHDMTESGIRKEVKDQKLTDLYIYWLEFEGDGHIGLGLGNQANQDHASAYLNRVDHAMSERIRYIRHMDDVIVFGQTKEEVRAAISEMRRVCGECGIELNANKTVIAPSHKGFTFLKMRYRVYGSGKITQKPCKRNTTTARRHLRYFKRESFDQSYIDRYFLNYAGRMRFRGARKALTGTATLFFSLYPDTRVRKKGERYVLSNSK